MILTDEHYAPSLRWRMAEYQALMRLTPPVKDRVVPLICLPDVEFDFESRQPKRTVHEYIAPFPKRFRAKWSKRPAWVTLSEKIASGRMNDGTHVLDYIFDQLRGFGTRAIPAISLAADENTVAAAGRAIACDQLGTGIILRLEDLMVGNSGRKVDALIASAGTTRNAADLIIDLQAPNFKPQAVFVNLLIAALDRLEDLHVFRNLVLLSTAIPDAFASVALGTDRIPRRDWSFYLALLAALPTGTRRPTFGDYTIVHPDFIARDMRMIKPRGKVIYTTTKNWVTRKGRAFRGNESQMREHCQEIIGNAAFAFKGSAFSYGDDYIDKCAKGQAGASNLTRWKGVGINHHITFVVKELATLAAAT